jgi:DNA-binding response OmpR family regulator
MPGLKGTEVLEKVRSLVEFSDIPVMMLTDMAQRFGQQKLQAGDLILDLQRRQVLIQNEEIKLTNTEFRLSSELVKNTGEPVSRGKPRRKALGQLNVNDRTIDVHILFLRRKLGNLGDQIETIRGQGYQFNLVG